MERLAQKIVELRKKNGKTQQELADFLGVKVACVCHWEKGRRTIHAHYITKLAEFFNVSTDYLFSYAPQQEREYHELEKEIFSLVEELEEEEINEVAKFIEFLTSKRKQ